MRYFYIFCGLIFLFLLYCNIHYRETYKIKGKVIEKITSSDFHGSYIYYHVLVRYSNDKITEIKGIDSYVYFEKNKYYIFTDDSLNFNK